MKGIKTCPCSSMVNICSLEPDALRSRDLNLGLVCPLTTKELFQIIPMSMMNKEIIPGRKKRV